jgi:hypothetical protein
MRLVITLLLLSGCSVSTKPIYRVGECIQSTYEREEWQSPPSIERVEKIGKSSYKTSWWAKGPDEWISPEWGPSFYRQNWYKVVPCPDNYKQFKD